MSDAPEPPPPPPPADYASPATPSPPDRKRLVQGIVLGVAGGIAILVGSPFLGAVIDQQLHPDAELSGLPGLVVGMMVGAALLLLATPAAFFLARRRHSSFFSGAARGLLLAIGLAGLTAGVCAVAM